MPVLENDIVSPRDTTEIDKGLESLNNISPLQILYKY